MFRFEFRRRVVHVFSRHYRNFVVCIKNFRTLPFAWLDVNSSTSYPLLHYTEASHWLPKLRTLSLGSNNIDMTVYRALQSIVGFSSLQALDLSHNALTGELRGSFDRYYCEGGGLNACNSAVVKTGASLLAIVLLASNFIEGGLKVEALPRSLTVFTVSDNLLQGPVPEDYSQLSAFFAGKKGLVERGVFRKEFQQCLAFVAS